MTISSIKGVAGFAYQGLGPGHKRQSQAPCAKPQELCLKRQEVCRRSSPSHFTAALCWLQGPLQQQVVVNVGGCGPSMVYAQVLLLDAMCSGML